MFVIVWEFVVKPEHVAEFERHYSSDGAWAVLFRQDPAYHQTILLRDPKQAGRYLTADYWRHESAFAAFKESARSQYLELDARFAELTEKETLIGHFEVAG